MRPRVRSIVQLGSCAVLLCAIACGEQSANPDPSTAGTLAVGSGGSGGAQVMAGADGASVADASGAATAGAAPAAGASSSPSDPGTAGSPSTAGVGGSAGSTPNGTSGTGGTAVAGNASSGSGGADAVGPCTRELLDSTIDAYFRALAAHDPSSLPLADEVKATENGKPLQLGQGLWQNAGMVKHTQSALDLEACSSATHAVVPEGAMDLPVALRLELVDQRITEIETIVVRPGDYQVLGSSFTSNTDAIIAANDTVKWEQPVPSAQRNSRDEIAAWIDKYFRIFPRGVCDVTSDCKRLENGGGSFACTLGASCAAGPPGAGAAALDPRLILVDEETGVGVGFTMFMGNTDMHMYKMHGDKVHAVHAILGAASSSGWD